MSCYARYRLAKTPVGQAEGHPRYAAIQHGCEESTGEPFRHHDSFIRPGSFAKTGEIVYAFGNIMKASPEENWEEMFQVNEMIREKLMACFRISKWLAVGSALDCAKRSALAKSARATSTKEKMDVLMPSSSKPIWGLGPSLDVASAITLQATAKHDFRTPSYNVVFRVHENASVQNS